MAHPPPDPAPDDDTEALSAAAAQGGALCTVTAIEGSWSRRLGAQLAVLPDGRMFGSLADGCLERALAAEARKATAPTLLRYGRGSPFVDIRLPCGSGIEVLVDPAPDRAALRTAAEALRLRRPASLVIGGTPQGVFIRHYLPRLRLIVLGSGPEVAALVRLAKAQGIPSLLGAPRGEGGDIALSLGQPPSLPAGGTIDTWCAIAVLFHDHEWEHAILPWALESPAFYVGAQGGKAARENRRAMLAAGGASAEMIERLKSPIGAFSGARTPSTLALAILAEVVAEYEALVDAAAGAATSGPPGLPRRSRAAS